MKKIYFWSILIFSALTFYPVSLLAQIGGGSASTNSYTIHDSLYNGQYADTTCLIHITNDSAYSFGSTITLTIHQSDTTKMLKISGHSLTDSSTQIQVYAGLPESGVLLTSDTLCVITAYRSASFVMDIPAGSFSQFHYTVECVDPVYEQPDTTIAIVPDSNGIIYVTQEGSGLRNGSSWANATPWLNRALTVADTMSERPVIWVAKGTYYGTPQEFLLGFWGLYTLDTCAFTGYNNVNVYGGFAGTEPADYNLNLRNFELNETVLDGMLHHTVLNLMDAEWNGFHIRHGSKGCAMESYNATLRKCKITNCIGDGVISHNTAHSNSLVDSCIIVDNTGSGINAYLYASNVVVSRNGGNGVKAGSLVNSIITNNGGYGFRVEENRTSSNCIVANNDGCGVYLANKCKIQNFTIVNNGGSAIDGGYSSPKKLENCILWGNAGISVAGNITLDGVLGVDLSHCFIDSIYEFSSFPNIPDHITGVSTNVHPGFVNPTAGAGSAYSGGDWHLLPNSVCVNRGVVDSYDFPETDIEGNPRIRQDVPDIGAYESDYNIQIEEGKIIYVKSDGDGDGSSWDHATPDLANAIESAWIYGPDTRIWVAEGIYPTQGYPFYVKEGLQLLGGFVGNEPASYDVNLRNPLAHPSVLEGQNQNRILQQTFDFDRSAFALVDGFTLTHGLADNSAGALLMANTTLSRCRVINNTVTGEGSAVVTVLQDTLKQVIVENNVGTGIFATASELGHCTVVRNSSDGIQMAVENIDQHNNLYNSIVWGNAGKQLHFTSAIAMQNTTALHCAFENQIVGERNISLSLTNTDAAGPQFIAPTDSVGIINLPGDWNIASSSVCVNWGTDIPISYGIITDLTGQPRVQNGNADIGALESPYSGKVIPRNMEVSIYEGESYMFYGTTLTNGGWYEHRWNVGDADSLVTLHLITKHVVYVSEGGAGSMNGDSWANALDGQTATSNGSTKLADALQVATDGTEFWIQSGTYYACSDSDVNKSLILNGGVALYGGFAGNETTPSQRDTNNTPTVFSGNLQNDTIVEHYSQNIFKTNELNTMDKTIVLDHIQITEGYNYYHKGCAIHIYLSSSVYANRCRFHHNYGTAIDNEGAFTASYCSLDSNVSYSDYWISQIQMYSPLEGAAAISNLPTGNVNFQHCNIAYNRAPEDGAIFNMGIMNINSSSIAHNRSTEESIGSLYNLGTLSITNCELSYNYSHTGISTILSSGLLSMYDCNLHHNQSYHKHRIEGVWQGGGGAAHVAVNGTADISHCLFTLNTQNGASTGGCINVNGEASIHGCQFVDNIGALSMLGFNALYGNIGEDEAASTSGISISADTRYINVNGEGIHVESGEVRVDDCIFDRQFGLDGTSVAIRNGKLLMNRCVFTRNQGQNSGTESGIIHSIAGEIHILNSLFANNDNPLFGSYWSSCRTTFTNCTFVNNGNFLINRWQGASSSDFADFQFDNCIIGDDMSINTDFLYYNTNVSVQYKHTLFYHPDSTLSSDCTPDSLGNIYYCDPMFVNPTTVMGVDSAQNPLLYDFRLMPGSPAINSGDTTGLHLAADATDLDGEKRVKRCQIDRGCYEYGTIVYDTVRETLCVEQDALNQLGYNGHGFSIAQLEVGESSFTRTCDCHPDANDTVQTLHLTVSLIQHSESSATVCDSLVWNGVTYTQSGTYTQILTDKAGCDSVATLHLTVNASNFSTFSETVCESFVWNNETFTNSGDYTRTFTNTAGCDSVVTLHLTVHEAVETVINDYVCNGTPYPFFGQDLYYPGTYTHTMQTVHGCDSTVTLHLELAQTYQSFENAHLCDGEGYPFAGETLHTAGTYTMVLSTAHGCDSTVVLTLTTGATTYGQVSASICDGESYNFHGQTLTAAGDYTVTLTNAHGCDSIVTLHLTLNHPATELIEATACDSYTWNGQTYTTSGDYTQTFTNASGCDSTVTLHLTVNPSVAEQIEVTTADSCYSWNNIDYCTSGDYTQTLQTVHGCDSIVTMHLTITVGIDDHDLGASMTVYPNPTNDIVNVQCTMYNVQAETLEFHMFDAYGKLVDGVETLRATSLQTDTQGSSVQTAQIDLSGFASGVYFVKAVADGKVMAVMKIVKQ